MEPLLLELAPDLIFAQLYLLLLLLLVILRGAHVREHGRSLLLSSLHVIVEVVSLRQRGFDAHHFLSLGTSALVALAVSVPLGILLC